MPAVCNMSIFFQYINWTFSLARVWYSVSLLTIHRWTINLVQRSTQTSSPVLSISTLPVGGGGGGGGGHCHWRLYQMRENSPQKSTLNEDLMVYQNTSLTGHTSQLPHPKWGLSCLHTKRDIGRPTNTNTVEPHYNEVLGTMGGNPKVIMGGT